MTLQSQSFQAETSLKKQRGRPRVANKKQFRNVAIPLETYHKIKELALQEDRTIARQVKKVIEQAYENENEVHLPKQETENDISF